LEIGELRRKLLAGLVIPAHPLALTESRKLDHQRQRALARYYCTAGAGGLAVAVHTTQFAIREIRHGLFQPVLELASETARERADRPILISGACGMTRQAVREAETASECGFDAALLSLADMQRASDLDLIDHCRAVAEVLPIFGFYLQPAVGGRPLSYRFWREFCNIPGVLAVKIAPFNRYQTIDVVRAVADSGRASEIALYTGNDDSIVVDLISPYLFGATAVRMVGGLLGQWAVGTRAAVELMEQVRITRETGRIAAGMLAEANALTDTNAALFDAANGFKGCPPTARPPCGQMDPRPARRTVPRTDGRDRPGYAGIPRPPRRRFHPSAHSRVDEIANPGVQVFGYPGIRARTPDHLHT
jgi:dihydrodipicolinate synthase/N-acetylneuraminate lyase